MCGMELFLWYVLSLTITAREELLPQGKIVKATFPLHGLTCHFDCDIPCQHVLSVGDLHYLSS